MDIDPPFVLKKHSSSIDEEKGSKTWVRDSLLPDPRDITTYGSI